MSDQYAPKNYTSAEIEAIKLIRQAIMPEPDALTRAKNCLDAMRDEGLRIEHRPRAFVDASLFDLAKDAVREWLAWKPKETPDTIGCPRSVVRAMNKLARNFPT